MSDSAQPTQAFPKPTASVTSDGTISSESLPTTGTTASGSSRYLLGEEIARGGMGEVYRATDAVLDREVAVKVLPMTFGGLCRALLVREVSCVVFDENVSQHSFLGSSLHGK